MSFYLAGCITYIFSLHIHFLRINFTGIVKKIKPSANLLLHTRQMTTNGKIENSIKNNILKSLDVEHLEVINESYMHTAGPETHFKVVVVSKAFEGISPIERHRMINHILREELEGGVHALSIQSKTPEQWKKSGGIVSASPNCLGGMAREKHK